MRLDERSLIYRPSNPLVITTVYPFDHPSLSFLPTPPLQNGSSLLKRVTGIVRNVDIVHLIYIRLSARTSQHDGDHISVAHRLESIPSPLPHARSVEVTARGHTTRRGLVRVRDLDRTVAEGRLGELEIHTDGIIRAGAGVHRLLQGDRGHALAREDQRGREGVVATARVGTATRDDPVGGNPDCGHDPG